MNFLKKYNIYITSLIKDKERKNIKLIIKLFEKPVRKLFLLINAVMLLQNLSICAVPNNCKNKIMVTENIIKVNHFNGLNVFIQ